MNEQPLSIWTIYDHPRDFPDAYVARRAEIGAGVVGHTSDTVTDQDLEKIRAEFRQRGLVRLPRAESDDPVIVEVWL